LIEMSHTCWLIESTAPNHLAELDFPTAVITCLIRGLIAP
jgi:hypothetical protein